MPPRSRRDGPKWQCRRWKGSAIKNLQNAKLPRPSGASVLDRYRARRPDAHASDAIRKWGKPTGRAPGRISADRLATKLHRNCTAAAHMHACRSEIGLNKFHQSSQGGLTMAARVAAPGTAVQSCETAGSGSGLPFAFHSASASDQHPHQVGLSEWRCWGKSTKRVRHVLLKGSRREAASVEASGPSPNGHWPVLLAHPNTSGVPGENPPCRT